MKAFRVLEPHLACSQDEHEQAYQRRAEKLVNKSEIATLTRALMTAEEFIEFCQSRGQQPYDVINVLLESFIWGHDAYSRAWTALRWLVKNLVLD